MLSKLISSASVRYWPAGDGTVLLAGDNLRPLLVSAAMARALAHCRPLRTLEQHCELVVRAEILSPSEISSFGPLLHQLKTDGLLDTLPAGSETLNNATMDQRVDIVIISADRPNLLSRCVQSISRKLTAYGSRARLTIFDGSRLAENSDTYLRLSRDWAQKVEAEVRYLGPAQKRRFIDALVERSAVPRDVVSTTLLGDARIACLRGANSNCAFLELVGRPFISVDDDVVWEISKRSPPVPADSMVFSGSLWPVSSVCYPSLERAADDIGHVEVDHILSHRRALGRTLLGLLSQSEHVVLEDALPELFLTGADIPSRVHATCSSFYGDSGSQHPWFMLFAGPESRKCFMTDEASYVDAVKSRVVWRGVPRSTAAASPFFQAPTVGFLNDQTERLPPFVPFYRCSDNLFGLMLSKSVREARTCFLAEGVRHAPEPPRAATRTALWETATIFRFYDVMQACMELFEQGSPGRTAESWSQGFAHFLRRASLLSRDDLSALLFEPLAIRAARSLEELDKLMKTHEGQPIYWADDARSFSAERLKWLQSGKLGRIVDVEEGTGESDPRLHLRQYADVLDAWPELAYHARNLAAEEVSLSINPKLE
jgi:hypothetical protein